MPLIRSNTSGRPRIVDAEPVIETRRGALYVPASGAWDAHGWGLYDAADRIVVSAATWAGSPPVPVGGTWSAPAGALAAAVPDPAPGMVHVYCGLLDAPPPPGTQFNETQSDSAHSGGGRDPEFLLDTLTRFWSHATGNGPGARLLFHSRRGLDLAFADGVVAASFAALGIGPADCVSYDAPTVLDCVVVPAASFESGRLAHRAYGRIMATLGERLGGRAATPDRKVSGPLHLSSARLAVPAMRDEAGFDDILARHGVAIVHPGEVSIGSLASRMRRAALVSCTVPEGGSGHGALTAFKPGGMFVVLSMGRTPAPDTLLIDAALDHDTLHLCPIDPAHPEPADEMARALLRAMQRSIVQRRLACTLKDMPDVRDIGIDIGRELVATRSSEGDGDPAAVLGGALTGTAQMRTGHQQRPWWQVDLGAVMSVTGVRVHAPLARGDADDAPIRQMRLAGSIDGNAWSVLASRDDDRPVGGLDGGSHHFASGITPWNVSHLRVQAMHKGVLALDQIEIQAEAAASEIADRALGAPAFEAAEAVE